MKLANKNGDRLDIRVIQYEFPNTEDIWDANWLIIEGRAVKNGKSWKFRDPCLLTSEAQSLQNWFMSIAKGSDVGLNMDFIEPELRFKRLGQYGMRVLFAYGAQPTWAGDEHNDREKGKGDFFIDFDTTPDQLIAAAQDMGEQLSSFPVR